MANGLIRRFAPTMPGNPLVSDRLPVAVPSLPTPAITSGQPAASAAPDPNNWLLQALGRDASRLVSQVGSGIMAPINALTGGYSDTYIDPKTGTNYNPQMLQDAANTASLVTVGGAPVSEPGALNMGVAYHGTPHTFDQFDLGKIGTGEGAQAFGHGLYFAGKKDVAEFYKNSLSRPVLLDAAGKEMAIPEGPAAGVESPESFAARSVRDELAVNPRLSSDEAIAATIADMQKEFDRRGTPAGKAWVKERLDVVQKWKDNGVTLKPGGNLYHVDIPDEHELLDWEKPISQQSPHVKEALKKFGIGSDKEPEVMSDTELLGSLGAFENTLGRGEKTGQGLYKELAQHFGGEPEASSALLNAGIPGHRFLDQNSRNPQALADAKGSLSIWEKALEKTPDDAYIKGEVEARRAEVAKMEAEQSHNYVIYDDQRIKILPDGSVQHPSGLKELRSSVNPQPAAAAPSPAANLKQLGTMST